MPGPWRDFVDSISAQFAFFPPRPSTYEVREHRDGSGELYIRPLIHGMPRIPSCKVMKLTTDKTKVGGWGGGDTIVTAYIKYHSSSQPSSANQSARPTLLYSHGNAVDLGQMLPVYREISKLLKVNVMGYDYTGYGASSGEPTMGKTFADISAVYKCLVDHYEVPPMSIILYGQSVGSGPSAWLGAHTRDIGGVVLHSPLLSGVRVLSPNIKWWPAFADVFTNHLFVPKIQAPVLIMHVSMLAT
ncbi:Alpha/Beta hydrolase protein [Dunaliella salina]|uniref:Alpha/Beta hydrolase protein n=1 Tax=Dunaliella salina TaxID=3046 RepID=A0ABQ7GJG9_DUNSA|nr:Alpha/Beta hydrolase protein [Dunaliella salina]|eukprot:KAF5834751.1 Alpha/Beta hydrolase protein [Dunaliella salina]